MYHFIADENMPRNVIKFLRMQGFEVISVFETMRGVKDTEILSYAVEHKLIIITFDRDFGDLIFRDNSIKPIGVVLFRFKDLLPIYAGEILMTVLQNGTSLVPFFTVISDDTIRQKLL